MKLEGAVEREMLWRIYLANKMTQIRFASSNNFQKMILGARRMEVYVLKILFKM